MARRNPLEGISDRVSSRFKKNLEAITKSKVVPFGEEEVTPAEFRSRFPKMSESQRRQVLEKNGQEEVLRQLRGK